MAAHRPALRRIAPPRFLAFVATAAMAIPLAIHATDWSLGLMIGFDIAALLFFALCVHLLRTSDPVSMRKAAAANDANPLVLLGISALASLAVLAAVAAELHGSTGGTQSGPSAPELALVMVTLVLAWLFGNLVYTLHYAHLFYRSADRGKDVGGLEFPSTKEPEYWDFVYFAFTLGMTFQTSDTQISSTAMRRIVTLHSLAAFVFNLGVIAFTINVLGGS